MATNRYGLNKRAVAKRRDWEIEGEAAKRLEGRLLAVTRVEGATVRDLALVYEEDLAKMIGAVEALQGQVTYLTKAEDLAAEGRNGLLEETSRQRGEIGHLQRQTQTLQAQLDVANRKGSRDSREINGLRAVVVILGLQNDRLERNPVMTDETY